MLSCEFCEISRNTFLCRTAPVAASAYVTATTPLTCKSWSIPPEVLHKKEDLTKIAKLIGNNCTGVSIQDSYRLEDILQKSTNGCFCNWFFPLNKLDPFSRKIFLNYGFSEFDVLNISTASDLILPNFTVVLLLYIVSGNT